MAVPDSTTPGPAPLPTKVSKWDRQKPPKDWRFWVGGLGKVLVATGLLMFAFVAYQLWGTGIETARAQSALEDDFNELLASTVPSVSTDPATTVPVDTAPAVTLAPAAPTTEAPATTAAPVPVDAQNLPPFQEGDVIARLEIPSIGVDRYVVAGVDKSDLKKGPGHYPETPLPGQLGNSAIAGHRTTYGQPFYDIDQVTPGDEIIVTTPAGRFVYIATGQQIVGPNDYEVVATTDPTIATLTLTSCHPRYTARDRIVITSELDPTQSDPVGESVLNYGRPLEPAAEAPPIRLDDPVVSAPPVTDTPATTSTATDTSIPREYPHQRGADDRPRRRGRAGRGDHRHRRQLRRGMVQRPERQQPSGPVGCGADPDQRRLLPPQPEGAQGLGRPARRDRAVHDRVVLLLPERQPATADRPLTEIGRPLGLRRAVASVGRGR